jgi:hypothetical protein
MKLRTLNQFNHLRSCEKKQQMTLDNWFSRNPDINRRQEVHPTDVTSLLKTEISFAFDVRNRSRLLLVPGLRDSLHRHGSRRLQHGIANTATFHPRVARRRRPPTRRGEGSSDDAAAKVRPRCGFPGRDSQEEARVAATTSRRPAATVQSPRTSPTRVARQHKPGVLRRKIRALIDPVISR